MLEKEIKLENQTKPYRQPQNTFGRFVKKSEDCWVWQVTDKNDNIVEELSPDKAGWYREYAIDIIFLKQVPSRESFELMDNLIFHTQYTYRIRDDQTNNIWSKYNQGKLYIRDISELGMTCEVGFDSCTNYTVTKTKNEKIDAETAKSIIQKTDTKYFYGKVINGEFVTTV